VSGRERLSDLHPDLLGLEPPSAEALRPDPRLRANVLASTRAATPLAGFAERIAALFDLARERASELLREAATPSAAWESFPVDAVRALHFAGGPRVAAADCGLVRIEAGARFPAHRHLGDEWSFVLLGEAEEEETGARWAPGDLVHRPAGSVHAFRVTSRGPFVFAAVLHGGLELPPRQ
jgi:putative transcriptional regulator